VYEKLSAPGDYGDYSSESDYLVTICGKFKKAQWPQIQAAIGPRMVRTVGTATAVINGFPFVGATYTADLVPKGSRKFTLFKPKEEEYM
jgi:hypothetical protein